MRWIATGGIACVLLLLTVAAPALSLHEYRPEPVEFSLPAPAAAPGEASAPVRAPKRFNLVGLTWAESSEAGVALRTRRENGEWTPWTPVAGHAEHAPDPGPEAEGDTRSSSPAWTGEADWIQVRASERLPGLRMRFVNVRGTATPADRARTAIRRAASSAALSLGRFAAGDDARAGGPQPAIVRRAAWGADNCRPRGAPDYGEVRSAYVHHTVNANDYTAEEAPDVVLAICRYHRNTNGWNDIGYNFLVDRYGTIYEGRAGGIDQAVVGAQAEGYNAQTTGIANLGTFSSTGQSEAALRAMAALIRWKLPLHGAPTAGTTTLRSAGGSSNRYPAGSSVRANRIAGHRDTGSTACPGNALYAQLPQLRSLVGNVGPSGTATSIRAKPLRSSVTFGRTTLVSGRLALAGAGPPLARVPVRVEAFLRGRWRGVATPTTAEDGTFSATIAPKLTRRVRARFEGVGDLRPSSSRSFTVAVKPVVTILTAPRRAAAGRAVTYRGRVTPRKPSVLQVLQVRRGRGYRTVGVRRLKVRRDGTFTGRFVPARRGAARFYVFAAADRTTARGTSRKLRLGVSRSRGGGAVAP